MDNRNQLLDRRPYFLAKFHERVFLGGGHLHPFGYLVSDEEFQNCELQTYIRSSPLANGGIFFRWKNERNRGFEVQIEDVPDSDDPAGSIYGRVRAERMPFQPGEWILMQVFLMANHGVVRVNGETVAESRDLGRGSSGKISLQMHSGTGWVRWKDFQVRRLSSDSPTPRSDNLQRE